MSKKDTINQRLNTFNNYLSALLTTIIALCGFTFSSAGGIINSPKWLIISSYLVLIICVVALVILQININKNQNELEDL